MYANYFKIFWLLRPIRNCVGNPWTINCRSERNRVGVWESIEGFKTFEQLINDSNQTTLSSKSARLKLVLRLFFLVVIRHFFMRITAVPFLPDARFRLSVPRSPFLVLVACEINEIKVQVFKKNVKSTSSEKKKGAKIQLVQRVELRDTGSNWSYEDRKWEVSFTLVNKNKKGISW